MDKLIKLQNPEINPRQDKILSILEADGYKTISSLSSSLDVSEQTIRRDLKKLEDYGFLSKYHGGASFIGKKSDSVISHEDTPISNIDLSLREVSFVEDKKAIAHAVSEMIPDGSSVFITIGSTVEYIARELLYKQNLLVITNSLRVASILYSNQNINVIIPSGSIRPFNGGIEGLNTLQDLKQFRTDFLISSIGAIADDGTLLDYNYTEVMMAKLMMQNAKQAIIGCDSSKFNSQAPIQLASIAQIHHLVTDKKPDDSLAQMLLDNNVELTIASK